MKDVLSLLSAGGVLAYLIVGLSLVPLFVKGIFALKISRSQQRKEFLELWKDGDKNDDFWLELMISHCFGAALPAALVRRVMRLPASPAMLSEIASSWSWFVYDSNSGRLDWKSDWRRKPSRSTVELRFYQAVYMILAFPGLMAMWKSSAHSDAFTSGAVFLVLSMPFLWHATNLSIASDTLKEMSAKLVAPEFGSESESRQWSVEGGQVNLAKSALENGAGPPSS
jgi:hypothetical protein